MFDLKIVNGLIISCTDDKPAPGCIAVRNRRIAAIGEDISGDARLTLDAGGHVVCPGFIDLHTHCKSAHNLNYLQAGVTTVVTGNCGFGRPPSDKPGNADGRCGTNMIFLTGHNSVRSEVMGNVNRAPTSAELDRMAKLVAEDMSAGAAGFSAGLTYVPGNYAETSELIHLARVTADTGGIYTVHMRNESDAILDSIAETARIGAEAGLPAHVSHLKLGGASVWGRSGEVLSALEAERERGVDISWDQYPYTASCGRILLLLSQWLQEGTADDVRERLQDPVMRIRAKEDVTARIKRTYDGDGTRVVLVMTPEPRLEGRNLAEVSEIFGRSTSPDDMAETVLDLVERYPGQGMIYIVSHGMHEGDVRSILKHPATMVASDGWSVEFGKKHTHPRLYGTFPRVLGRYVRDEKLLTLDKALCRMTSMPAARLGLDDRGILAEGAWADIVAFDPSAIRDTATFEKPHQYAVGIDWVMVNGEVVVDHGKATGSLPGLHLSRSADS